VANHLKGEVAFEAGGQSYTFRLGVNEMIELQNQLGLAGKDAEFLEVLGGISGFGQVRACIYVGLRKHHPEVTEELAGDIVTELGMSQIPDIIRQALRWALPEKEEGAGGGRGKPARPSRGPTSS
jgi:hypothetical protein